MARSTARGSGTRRFTSQSYYRSVRQGTAGIIVAAGATALWFLTSQETTQPAATAPNSIKTDFYPDGYKSIFTRVSDLQVQISGKTNGAFVFVKPHAADSEATITLVREHFKKHGIRVTGEGKISAEDIDSKMLIDTHYGAIASKAVKLKPAEMNVSEKAQVSFEKLFGESWESAVAAGKVYNAKDACTKLGVDGSGLDDKWATLNRGENMVKFGGGFYCGLVDGVYVINGFYMSMRGSYTRADSNGVHYFTVQWPTESLSWSSFRNDVLGSTNPVDAATGSVRRQIYEEWETLGLPAEPNVGDNGVHASASPFEALAERANWLGTSVEDDAFGKGLLAAGVGKEKIIAWSSDPQVKYDGEQGSLFDLLEDLDSDQVIVKAKLIEE